MIGAAQDPAEPVHVPRDTVARKREGRSVVSRVRVGDVGSAEAGLPGGGNPRLQSLRRTPGWQAHATRMDNQFRTFDRGYLPKIQAFRPQLGSLSSPPVLFYPFGGPDYLFANAFFPGARNAYEIPA